MDRLENSDMLNILERLHTACYDLHYLICSSDAIEPRHVNRVFDLIQDTTMDFLHESQEIRREYNSRVRVERHRERLRLQRERSAATRVAPRPAAPVPREIRVEPAEETRRAPVARMKKPISKALKKSDLERMMPDDCGICMERIPAPIRLLLAADIISARVVSMLC